MQHNFTCSQKGEAEVREEPDCRGLDRGALSRSVRRPDHGTEDSRWSRSAMDIAEPASGLRMYPEAVLVRTETAFGSGVPRRRNNR